MGTRDIKVFLLGKGGNIEENYAVFFEKEVLEDWMEDGDEVIEAKLVVPKEEEKITVTGKDIRNALLRVKCLEEVYINAVKRELGFKDENN